MASEIGHRWLCPPRAVVAAADFEPPSARAVGLAGSIAAATAATLRVVHAERFDAPPYFTLEQIARLDDERREATAEVTTELSRFVKSATTWPAELVVAEGAALDVILQAAEGADLIVLGTHGRRGPSRWWLGSVAERVVRAAEIPVLVTRADTPPSADVFARVVLVWDASEPDAETRGNVGGMAAALGGQLVSSQPFETCGPEVLASATVVAVAAPRGRSRWGLSDTVTDTLGRCARPVLFLPER